MRLAGLIKGGYYPTPIRCVDLASRFITVGAPEPPPQRETLRILDPCCGPGDACERLAANLSVQTNADIRTFGVELEQGRAQQARGQMDFALSSDLFQTMIANNTFHILFLNPPYDHDQEDKRVEHAFLSHCTRYLAEKGLLILIVPRHRLAVSARYLASHYRKLRCWRFPDPEYEDFDQIVLMGNRTERAAHNGYLEKMVLKWARCPLEQMKTLEEEPENVTNTVATGEHTEVLFTIRTVDPQQAAAEAMRSGLWNNQAIRDSLWPLHTRKTQPLMPLRQGHMAMLIAAGFLDNLQLEAEGKRVLVKGQTIKKMEMIRADEDEEIWQERMYTTIRTLDLDTGEIENVETVREKSEKETREEENDDAPDGTSP